MSSLQHFTSVLPKPFVFCLINVKMHFYSISVNCLRATGQQRKEPSHFYSQIIHELVQITN